jgi:AcrR family transcriptional regulator
VPRSGEEARRRLQQAALDLYRERGFDHVTAVEIAARAGVTERTFFRHFPDKREVLFDGEAALRTALVRAVAEAPDGLEPLDILLRAYRSAVPLLADNRAFSESRLQVIAANPALRERDLGKAAALTDAMASALRQRGVADRMATLAAQTGYAAFSHAVFSWFDDASPGLDTHLVQAFTDLHNLASGAVATDER